MLPIPMFLKASWIKYAIGAAVVLAVVGGSAYMGYEYRDGKAAQEALERERAERDAREALVKRYDKASADYEAIIAELRARKPEVITKYVEKEIENIQYRCVLPASGLRTHEGVLESLKSSRRTGKLENAVPGSTGNGTGKP